MKHRCYHLGELAAIHKSLVVHIGMPENEAMELVYQLNTANLDTMLHLYGMRLHPLRPFRFYAEINRRGRRMESILRLARSMEDLLDNIVMRALTEEQRNAVRRAQDSVDSIHDKMSESEDALLDALMRAVCQRL